MGVSRLATLNYQDKKISVSAYSDSILFDPQNGGSICAIRFGGYPEAVRAVANTIYGGEKISVDIPGNPCLEMHGLSKQYREELSYLGTYAEATMIYKEAVKATDTGVDGQESMQTEYTYLFCRDADPDTLFHELDQYTVVSLIPEFRDFLIGNLIQAKYLQSLDAYSTKSQFCGWRLRPGKTTKTSLK